jgi:DNA-binding MarR family transcriptional regulator
MMSEIDIQFELCTAQRAVSNYFKGILSDFQITPAQYALLKCLWAEDMKTPSQLAKELRLDAATVTGILDRMEKSDLLERVNNRQSRRSVSIHLLERGVRLREPVERAVSAANCAMTLGFESRDLAELKALLRKLDHNVKTSQRSAARDHA